MFRGNRPVLILPGILMIVMFIGGYQFLSKSEEVTNEQLQDVIELEATKEKTNDKMLVDINWDCTVMPSEGLYGEDYLGVTVIDQATGKVPEEAKIVDAKLDLLHGDQIIKQIEGIPVPNGVIFEFPTKLIDHKSFGNAGQASITIEGEQVKEEMVTVHLLHTWTAHSPLELTDASFKEPTFEHASNVRHWVISR